MFATHHLSTAQPVWSHLRARRGLVLIALVWLSDWLFFGRTPGISLVLFACILAFAAVTMVPHRAPARDLRQALALLVVALVPSLQAVNALSLAFVLAGLTTFTLLVNRRFAGNMLMRLAMVRVFAATWPVRLMVDLARLLTRKRAAAVNAFMPLSGAAWIVPVAFSLVFVSLFASANPLIGGWIRQLDLFGTLGDADPLRWGFWVAALVFCWPFLRVRTRTQAPVQAPAAEPRGESPRLEILFSELAVFRSLLLFNGIFGLQNALDATFLWGGAALPDGMTYATYAHRGAYTLIVTALLAAGFVLFATRRGAPSEHSARVRWLLLLWTAQNALLVQYCVVRLNFYVDAYALTYWRVAAFAWMGLVFAGLVLILAKFILGKSAAWLVRSNLICLFLVLYGAANINLPALIANHNVRLHESRASRTIDTVYLASLGPAALPAIDQVLANPEQHGLTKWSSAELQLMGARNRLTRRVRRHAADWRTWGWRLALIKAYLEGLQGPDRLVPWQPAQP